MEQLLKYLEVDTQARLDQTPGDLSQPPTRPVAVPYLVSLGGRPLTRLRNVRQGFRKLHAAAMLAYADHPSSKLRRRVCDPRVLVAGLIAFNARAFKEKLRGMLKEAPSLERQPSPRHGSFPLAQGNNGRQVGPNE